MSLRNQIPDHDDSNTVILPEPCSLCAPNDGNWRVYQDGDSVRCSCPRGRLLAGVDERRAHGKLGKNFKCVDPGRSERDRNKWARWKAEHEAEKRSWGGAA